MRHSHVRTAFVFLLGILLGSVAVRLTTAENEPFTRTELMKTDLEGVKDKEVGVFRVEFAGGGASPRHYHNGQEFGYVLEGKGVLEIEGQPPKELKAGDVVAVPYKKVHLGKNASDKEPFKLIVFAVGDKGQPWTVNIEEGKK